jgi:hypothetical protein
MEIGPLVWLLHQPLMIDDDKYGVVDGMIGKENRSTRSAPVTLCSPQIPRNLTQARTGAVASGIQRLSYDTARGCIPL